MDKSKRIAPEEVSRKAETLCDQLGKSGRALVFVATDTSRGVGGSVRGTPMCKHQSFDLLLEMAWQLDRCCNSLGISRSDLLDALDRLLTEEAREVKNG